MADLVRTSKSGSEWTTSELDSYKIRIIPDNTFFGISLENIVLSVDIDTVNFDYEKDDISSTPKPSRRLLGSLDLATRSLEESMVDDFGVRLLEYMDYDPGDRIVRSRHILCLTMCSIDTMAQTDVCIMRRKGGLLLLLQEDKRQISLKNPEPQVIAEAIAAFQENNMIRSDAGLEPLEEMIFPCITMVGTFPRFYLVPVTKELDYGVRNGVYPNVETIVLKYVPRVPRRISDGMRPVENRKKILQCFEAFKKFVDDIEKELEKE